MSNIINFSDRLKAKTDELGGDRQVLSSEFVELALANDENVQKASDAFELNEDAINAAIFNFEVARARWRCAKNV